MTKLQATKKQKGRNSYFNWEVRENIISDLTTHKSHSKGVTFTIDRLSAYDYIQITLQDSLGSHITKFNSSHLIFF